MPGRVKAGGSGPVRGAYYALTGALARSWGRISPESLARVLGLVRLLEDSTEAGRRRIYLGHLKRILPSLSPRERKSVLHGYWVVHQRAMLGLYLAGDLAERPPWKRVEWTGREHLDAALSRGGGAVLLAPHFGDERTLHILLATAGYPIHVISTDYRGASERVRRARLETSMRLHHVAFPDQNPRWMYRALEAGEIVQIAPTAYGGPRGIAVSSFGVPVLASATPFRLAAATGCATLIALNHVLPGLRYRIELLPFRVSGDPFSDAGLLFDELTALGKLHPRQYNWMNLAIRHRETNTMLRLGRIPADERDLEALAVPEDEDPGRIGDLAALASLTGSGRASSRSPTGRRR